MNYPFVDDLMERIPQRQYLLWMLYLREEWNQPTRADYYVMQICVEIRRLFSKNPGSIVMKAFKIVFNFGADKPKPVDLMKKAMDQKALIIGMAMANKGVRK